MFDIYLSYIDLFIFDCLCWFVVLLLGLRVVVFVVVILGVSFEKVWLILVWVSIVVGNLMLVGLVVNLIVCE